MTFTEREQNVVMGVFGELLRREHNNLNTFLGSETIKEMSKIYSKLRHEPYCEKYGIKYEDMTEDDFIREYEEEAMTESEYFDMIEDVYYGSDYEY